MLMLMKMIFFIFSITLLLSGCTAHHQGAKIAQVDETTNGIKTKIILDPAGSHEECMLLKKGQVLIYRFAATKPVDFNIHYHMEDGVSYPVSQREVTEYDGILDAEKNHVNMTEQETFCMMWENQDMRRLSLSYECRVKEK